MIKANISINLTKLGQNKAKISTSKKGEKWANLEIAVKDEVDQYNQNISVKFSKDKNDPEAPPIWLGNGSTYWTDGVTPKTSKEMNQPQQQTAAFQPAADEKEVDDDLPF
tara:strand:+ start:1328 stop:1657 length:330 start_codon:yes stop_codon:yes gene_type:complete